MQTSTAQISLHIYVVGSEVSLSANRLHWTRCVWRRRAKIDQISWICRPIRILAVCCWHMHKGERIHLKDFVAILPRETTFANRKWIASFVYETFRNLSLSFRSELFPLRIVLIKNKGQYFNVIIIWASAWENVPSYMCNKPAHLGSLIRVFHVRMQKFCILGCPKCAQGRFWSDCANAQADLNLRWAHTCEGTFPDVDLNLRWAHTCEGTFPNVDLNLRWAHTCEGTFPDVALNLRWAHTCEGTFPDVDLNLRWAHTCEGTFPDVDLNLRWAHTCEGTFPNVDLNLRWAHTCEGTFPDFAADFPWSMTSLLLKAPNVTYYIIATFLGAKALEEYNMDKTVLLSCINFIRSWDCQHSEGTLGMTVNACHTLQAWHLAGLEYGNANNSRLSLLH